MSLEFPPPSFTPQGGDWVKDTNDTVNNFPKYKTTIHNANHGNGVYVAWSNSVYDLNGTNEWPPSGAFDKLTTGVNNNERAWASANDADGQYGATYSTSDKPSPVNLYLTIPLPINITSYSIVIRDSTPVAQAPKKWNFYGSYNGDDWTLIHTQDNETSWTTSETRTYSITGNHTHRHFRWEWLRNNGNALISVGEIKVFGTPINEIGSADVSYRKLNSILLGGANKEISLTDMYSIFSNNPFSSTEVSFQSLQNMKRDQRFSIVEPFLSDPLSRGWTSNNNGFVTLHSSGKGIVITHTAAFFMTRDIPFMNGVYEIDFELSDYNGKNHYNLIVSHDGTVTTIGGTQGWHPNTNAHALVVDSVSSGTNPDNNTVRVSSGSPTITLENLNQLPNGNLQGVNTEGVKYTAVMELNRDAGIIRTYIEGKDVFVHDNQSKYHNFNNPAMGFGVDNITSGGLTIYEMRARPILQDVWTFYDDFGSSPTLAGKHTYKNGMTHVYRPAWTVSDSSMVTMNSNGMLIDNSTSQKAFFMTTRIPMQDGVWETEFSLGATFPVHLNFNVIHGGAVTAIGGGTSWNPNNESYSHVNDCRLGGDNNMVVTNSAGNATYIATNNDAEVSSTGRYIARMVLDRTNGIFTTQIIGKTLINLNSGASTYNFATPYIGFGFDGYQNYGTVTIHSIRGYSINPITSDIGTTIDNPAPSAWFLKHVVGRTGIGTYYIRPPGSSDVIRTLCLFDLFGGGWCCFLAGSFDDTYRVYGVPSNTSGITNGNIFNSSTVYGTQDLSDTISGFTFSSDFDLTTSTFATPDTWFKQIPRRGTNREYLFFVTGNSSGDFDSHSINNHAWLRPTLAQDFLEIGNVGNMAIDTPSIKVRGNIPPTPRWWSRDMHLDTNASGLTPTLSSEDAFGYSRSDPTNHFSSGQYLLKFVR